MMLPLIAQLIGALESEGVSYCHWKSNVFQARAAVGEDDLDLLIGHSSKQKFLAILKRLGFIEALNPKARPPVPGILDYFGYDETGARPVHAHVHFKLVLGQNFTKNYHLPIEEAFLGSAKPGPFFRTPSPEFEFIVFVIRMVLKYATWNALFGGGGLSAREQKELEYLRAAASRERIGSILARDLPYLTGALFDECLRILPPRGPIWLRLRTGHRLQRALRACSRRPLGADLWLQLSRRISLGVRRRSPGGIPKKRMKNGGMLVAVVGGDGAGKSTAIDALSKWLSSSFATLNVHLGKPAWSKTTWLTRAFLKVGRSLGLYPFTRASSNSPDSDGAVDFPGYPSLIRAVCTARDRYHSYLWARRKADSGMFVICDRFPLAGILSMDGPRIERSTRGFPPRRSIRFLSRLESKYYRSIPRPDLLFVLKVDPRVAVERKADELEEFVWARSSEIWAKAWEGSPAHVIDANLPPAEVLRRMKSILWAHL